MVSLKKKQHVQPVAKSPNNEAEGQHKQGKRSLPGNPAATPANSRPKKKHKSGASTAAARVATGTVSELATSATPRSPSSAALPAAPTCASSGAAGRIQIGGGFVDCAGLDKALRALCRHVQKRHNQDQSTDLLAGGFGPTVCLMFSLQNIPERQKLIPHLIELPHSPLDQGSEACLIVRDPQRKWKDVVASSASLSSSITKVISCKKLPKKYPQFQDKRALAAAFDLFLVDTSVKEKAYNALGKAFHSANRLPLPIRVGVSTLEREVEKALRCTSLVLRRGPSVAVRIGRALGSPEHLYANAIATINGVSSFFKENHKWKNTITTIHVQATDSPALPVYIHPKYKEAAEFYRTNKPPSLDATEKGKEGKNDETKKKGTPDAGNAITDCRKIKRGKNAKPNERKDKESKKPKKHALTEKAGKQKN
ncbi:putative ribosome biogenesis protein C8F11.04 [Cyclospora cayetanensis]|nr:putative ribosome biogenesis protein C8F11.04 [Cyclospora cayetanensis]